MDTAYPGRGIISKKNRKLFAVWNQQDPVDRWECERERRVAKIQDNRNPFVAERCPDQ
ncbi:MAG: endonuclease [Desulforhopalus sp.]|nr:endonuclease [Desulforhopalus sp.]